MEITIKSVDFNEAKEAAKKVSEALDGRYAFRQVREAKDGRHHVITEIIHGGPRR